MKRIVRTNGETGLTLIECCIALVVTMIGVLAAAGLIAVGIRMQVESRDATGATSLARAKLEQLQNSGPTSTARARGGSLTSDLTGYNDLPNPQFRRRWLIETNPADAGVPANTQRITVIIIPAVRTTRLPDVRITTLVPSS